ncbi:hypothetical protein PIB30_061020 [Stylosanthes scabra]|uniref:Uncharacterized protein n=1 Tax=Stylosanthes scabra TaxID=79078 RepID=A0ABU6UJI3_9FABA|nr:hypothetical protein [Stylosanthes scabra]
MQFLQQSFYENMQKSQAEYMEEVKAIKAKQEELWNNTNRFHSQIKKEQDMLSRETQEIRKGQINQTLMNTQRADAEKNLEQAVKSKLGRPTFYGALKSHIGASASSQSAQQEPVPLWTAPPLPSYQPPRGPPN